MLAADMDARDCIFRWPMASCLALAFLAVMPAAVFAQSNADVALRIAAMVRPVEARAQIRKQLETAATRADPVLERDLLYLLAAAASRIPDQATVSDAQLRLHALGTAHHDPQATAYSEFIRGDQKMVYGDLDGGLAQTLRAADAVRGIGEKRLQAFVNMQLCSAYMLAEQYGASRQHCDAAVGAWRALHDPLETGSALNLQGLSLMGAGETAAAIERFEQARTVLGALGDAALVSMVGDNLAEACSASGQYQRALELSQQSLRAELASGRAIHAMMSRKNVAVALLGLGRDEDAWKEIRLAETAAWQNGYLHELPPILRASARIAARLGRHEDAARASQQAVALSRGSDSDYAASILEDLDTRLRDREAAVRVRQLEQDQRQRAMQLNEAKLSAERRGLAFVIAIIVAAGFLVTAGLLLLMWRQQRRHARSMQSLAHADALTGLANRRAVTRDFESRVNRAQRGGQGFWLLLMDLDHFKRINDTAGHNGGDVVLQRVAAVLGDTSRFNDLAGRIGGEEFVLLFDELREPEARALAERVRTAVMDTRMPDPWADLRITISGGLARFPEDGRDWDALFACADQRLYRAKQAGRNRVAFSNTENCVTS